MDKFCGLVKNDLSIGEHYTTLEGYQESIGIQFSKISYDTFTDIVRHKQFLFSSYTTFFNTSYFNVHLLSK